MKKWKIILSILGALVLSFVLFLYFSFSGTPWGKIHQKNLMLSYLNEKYQQKFEMEKMRFNPLGSGYYGTAHPKSNPHLKFNVAVSADEESGYADLYPVEFWKTKEARPIEDSILTLFPDIDRSRFTLDRKTDEEGGMNVPTFRSVHFDMGYSGVLSLYFKEDWFQKTDEERNTDLQNIRKLADYLQEKHLPVLVRIFYDTEDYTHFKGIFITQKGEIIQN